MIILKDVFQHWPNDCISTFIQKIISTKKTKFIWVVNCGYQEDNNSDILLGRFHPLNSNLNPLLSFGFTELFTYRSKQVSVLRIN